MYLWIRGKKEGRRKPIDQGNVGPKDTAGFR